MDQNIKKQVAIVIPFYKFNLNWFQKISLQQVLIVLKNYDKYFLVPEHLNLSKIDQFLKQNNIKIKRLNDNYFLSVSTYNNMCFQSQFYELFSDYEYMLLYQLDAFVFKDQLKYWCQQGYDYIGAPWCFKCNYNCSEQNKQNSIKEHKIGNGGFSLRKIDSFIKETSKGIKTILNEDQYFSNFNNNLINWKYPTCDIAKKFAVQSGMFLIIKQYIPFGCHNIIVHNGFMINYFRNIPLINLKIKELF